MSCHSRSSSRSSTPTVLAIAALTAIRRDRLSARSVSASRSSGNSLTWDAKVSSSAGDRLGSITVQATCENDGESSCQGLKRSPRPSSSRLRPRSGTTTRLPDQPVQHHVAEVPPRGLPGGLPGTALKLEQRRPTGGRSSAPWPSSPTAKLPVSSRRSTRSPLTAVWYPASSTRSTLPRMYARKPFDGRSLGDGAHGERGYNGREIQSGGLNREISRAMVACSRRRPDAAPGGPARTSRTASWSRCSTTP